MDYYDEYKSRHPEHFVELMIIANKIPRERRERLSSYGIAFKEIPESEFPSAAKNRAPYRDEDVGRPSQALPRQLMEEAMPEHFQSPSRDLSDLVFEDFEQWLSRDLKDFKEFSTLGGKSHFHVKYDQGARLLTFISRTPRTCTLKRAAIEKIFARWKNAPASRRYMSSYYQLPPSRKKFIEEGYTTEYWGDAPDKIATPGIPSVIRYWVENILGQE
jgi:hypothetical protein